MHVPPAWVTVKVLPATTSVPLRDDVDAFAAAVKVMLPLLVRFVPFDTVIQVEPETAVHTQADEVVTVTVPVPPPAATACVVGEIV